MRALVAVLTLASVPSLARADLELELPLLHRAAPAPQASMPLPRLDLPRLSVDRELVPAVLDDGSGAGDSGMSRSDRAILALVLGIIPGFGIGHVIADSKSWVVWLVVDVVLLVVAVAISAGAGSGLAWLIIIPERILEGIDAYNAALGRHFLSQAAPQAPPAGSLAAVAAGAPRAVLPVARW